MKLIKFEISDFQCIRSSNPVRVGDLTCLLGKNEAGKTALLKALYKLNPVIEADATYDVVDDFPRSEVDEYEYRLSHGESEPATVCRAEFELQDDEIDAIAADFGPDALNSNVLTVSKGYDNARSFFLDVNTEAAYKHFVRNLELPAEISEGVYECFNFGELAAYLQRSGAGVPAIQDLVETLEVIQKQGLDRYIYLHHLRPRLPQFVYFNDYYQLRGQEDLQALKERLDSGELRTSDYAMLGLMKLARLDVEQLLNPGRTQLLINKLEGAGNAISQQMFRYWSQNPDLQVKFDVRPSNPDDPAGDTGGMYIWTSVFDPAHSHSTLLGARSRGFVWFFSFLAWYSELREHDAPLILLLDEPGLSLHAEAQADLLRFFEETLSPHHQLIYSTHSPFMVDPDKPRRVRYVEDMSQVTNGGANPDTHGTKVTEDPSQVSEETSMPLELMRRVTQTDTKPRAIRELYVEDVADCLYLRAMSRVLSDTHETGLDDWTIVPVAGVENVPSLLAQHSHSDEPRITAILSNIGNADREIFDAFLEKQLVPEHQVRALTSFSQTREAGMEDLFDIVFYINLVNAAYRSYLPQSVRVTDLRSDSLRIRERVADYLENGVLTGDIRFNHRRPARLFADNVDKLRPEITKSTRDRFSAIFQWLQSMEP
ncbi:MAG TPA: AAA family ATPase [Arenicellales bacterium]|nr:AAA family ATPase [Arenicellales bacterium]